MYFALWISFLNIIVSSMYFEYLIDLFLDFRLLYYLTTDLFLSKGRNMQVMYVLYENTVIF